MKVTISIPDPVFREAEKHARRTKRSRSRLYVDALSEYLARHSPDEVTDAMNKVVDELPEARDPVVTKAARRVLSRVEW